MDWDAGVVKRCPACGQSKAATPEYFFRDKNRPDGLTPRCKACFRDQTYGNLKVTVVVDGMRQCSGCGEWKPLDREHFTVNRKHSTGFYSACKECRSERRRASYDPEPTRTWRLAQMEADPEWMFKQTRRKLLLKYGITPEQYDAMFTAQGGVCAICKRPETSMVSGRVKSLAVDHNHATGAVRALLCSNCNHGLGHFDDDADRILLAAEYVRRYE